jgi:hypothetical protein
MLALVALAAVAMVSAAPARAADADAETAPPTIDTPVAEFAIGIAGTRQEVDGNTERFRQYVTLPQDVHFSEIRLHRLAPRGRWLLDLDVRDFGEPGASGELWWSFGSGLGRLRSSQRRSEFYRDWSSADNPLTRRDSHHNLAVKVAGGELGLHVDRVRFSGAFASEPEDWVGSTMGASYARQIGSWGARLGVDQERFSFRQGAQFSGETTTTSLQLIPVQTDRTLIEASGAIGRTSLDNGIGSPTLSVVSLQGTHVLSPEFTVTAEVSRREVGDAITQNAYAKRNLTARLAGNYALGRSTEITAGGEFSDIDYVNGMQTAIISTKVNNGFIQATTRLGRRLKLKASHSRVWLRDRPLAFDLGGSETIPLSWSNKIDEGAQLSYAIGMTAGLSAGYHRRRWENEETATRNSIISRDVSAWWMPNGRLTLYGSYLNQDFGLFDLADITPYATNDEIFVVGGNYQFTPRWSAGLSFSDAESSNSLAADQHALTFNLNHITGDGDEVSLRWVVDDFATSEAAPDWNYNANVFELRFTMK